jgi:hypothetical protein
MAPVAVGMLNHGRNWYFLCHTHKAHVAFTIRRIRGIVGITKSNEVFWLLTQYASMEMRSVYSEFLINGSLMYLVSTITLELRRLNGTMRIKTFLAHVGPSRFALEKSQGDHESIELWT